MNYHVLSFVFAVSLLPLMAQDKTTPPEGETNWPGIHFQIMYLARIQQNHLLVGVRLYATTEAPAGGTLIGVSVPIPANAKPSDIAAGAYRPSPFTMDSSTMTDELSQKTYPVVPSVALPGHKYRPAVLLEVLTPGQGDMVTLQFEVPPPPPPPEPGQLPIKQTLSFLFTNAKGAINKVPLPPPVPAPSANP
jgi:hypothetical protein